MRFVVFWDYSSRYVLDTLKRCVTHDVVGSIPLADNRIESLPEQIAAFKQTELDAFVVAVSRKSLMTEWILSYLRAFDMTQPVYIIKDRSVLSGCIPFMYRETFMDERVILLKQQGRGIEPYIAQLQTHVCDDCNLNCKACHNFSPFVGKKSLNSVDRYAADLERILSVYKLGRIVLLGGEPLLYPEETSKFVAVTRDIAKSKKQFPDLEIFTNGLTIPSMSSDFWRVLTDNGCILSISVYPPTLKLMPDVWDILEKHEVHYRLFKVSSFFRRLLKTPTADPHHSNRFCHTASCHYFRDGYLYKCVTSGTIKHLDEKLGTHYDTASGLPLEEVEKDPLGALEKLNGPINLCRFCDIANSVRLPWERVHGDPSLEDWVIPEI